MKLQTLQAVVAATLVCVGTPSIAQQPYYYGQPARSTQGAESRVYQYPTMYAALAENNAGPVEQATLDGTDQLTYNDYYAEGPTPADGTAQAADAGSSAAGSGAGSCCGGSGSCCNTCCDPCCNSIWGHCTGLYAEALFLRPRGADVPFAVVHNGVDPATFTSFGTVATANPDYSFGYRGGAIYGLNQVSSIQVGYTYFQSETNGSIFTAAPLSIHSLVTDPHTFTAASDSLAGLARYNVRFQFADVDYRRLLAGGRNWGVNYSVGTRYAQLTELFRSAQPIGPGSTNVGTNVKFDGMGARVGLQGARKMANRGFMMYGNGFASVLPGNARASYLQTNTFAGTQVANSWKDFRTVSILEFELGGGWQNASGRLRLTAGYYFAVWFNTLGTNDYIQAVQTNDYVNRNSAITFDGLTTRLQYVW